MPPLPAGHYSPAVGNLGHQNQHHQPPAPTSAKRHHSRGNSAAAVLDAGQALDAVALPPPVVPPSRGFVSPHEAVQVLNHDPRIPSNNNNNSASTASSLISASQAAATAATLRLPLRLANPQSQSAAPLPLGSPPRSADPGFVSGPESESGAAASRHYQASTLTSTSTPTSSSITTTPNRHYETSPRYLSSAVSSTARILSSPKQPSAPSSYASTTAPATTRFPITFTQPPRAAPPNALGSGPRPSSGFHHSSLFDLPPIPTTDTDDFAAIPYLNSTARPSSRSPSKATMSQQLPSQQQQQQQQQQQFSVAPRQRAPISYGPGHEELHMQTAGSSSYQQQQHHHQQSQHAQMSPREYSAASAGPHIKLDHVPSNASTYQSSPSVPSVLQPGGPVPGRPSAVTASTAPAVPTLQGSIVSQQQDFQTPSKPSLSLSHSYSRSSPAAGAYDGHSSGYGPYTPTTPSGSTSTSQFMSPTDRPYNAPGSQRNISHTPLGLADIRPRADSSLSDGMPLPGSIEYTLANAQPGTSNHLAPWALYAFDWCKWAPQGNGAGKLAVGSYLEDGHNFIQILDTQMVPTPSDVYSAHGGSKYTMEFTKVAEATHSYPVTRLLWEPPSSTKQSTDLLATSGDHLRLWSLPTGTPSHAGSSITNRGRDVSATTKITPLALLSNSKTPDHTAPLTSLDWNTVSPSLIITSSIDTTCTIWDIPSLTAKTQLIAHDKEVYDVRFCANSVDVFVSCGQDGSVRMFDLRSLEHSTIIYEPTGKEERDSGSGRMSPTLAQQTMSNPPPLLRLATSPHDTQLLATFAQDSNIIRILDVRQPGQALLELRGHGGAVNCVEWSPSRRGQLASGADDCQVLIWDLMNQSQSAGGSVNGASQQDNSRSPIAGWQCEHEVGNLGWIPHLANSEYGEWLGVSAGRGVWGVRMG